MSLCHLPSAGSRVCYYAPGSVHAANYNTAVVASSRFKDVGDGSCKSLVNLAVLAFNGEWTAKRDVEYADSQVDVDRLLDSGVGFCTTNFLMSLPADAAKQTPPRAVPDVVLPQPVAVDADGTSLQRGDPVICVNADGNDALHVHETYEVVEIVSANVISVGGVIAGSNRFKLVVDAAASPNEATGNTPAPSAESEQPGAK